MSMEELRAFAKAQTSKEILPQESKVDLGALRTFAESRKVDSKLESLEAPQGSQAPSKELDFLPSLGPRPRLTPPGTPFKATQQEVLLIGQTNRLGNQGLPLDAPLAVKYVAWANLKKIKSPPDAIGAYIAMSGNKPDFENPQGWKPLSTGDKFLANAIQAYMLGGRIATGVVELAATPLSDFADFFEEIDEKLNIGIVGPFLKEFPGMDPRFIRQAAKESREEVMAWARNNPMLTVTPKVDIIRDPGIILRDPVLLLASSLPTIAYSVPVGIAYSAGGPVAGLKVASLMGMGETYVSAVEAGLPESYAAMVGIVAGPIIGKIEMMQWEGILKGLIDPKLFKSQTSKFLTQRVLGTLIKGGKAAGQATIRAGGEGAEEFLQFLVQEGTITLAQSKMPKWKELSKGATEAFTQGVTMGVILGGGSTLKQLSLDKWSQSSKTERSQMLNNVQVLGSLLSAGVSEKDALAYIADNSLNFDKGPAKLLGGTGEVPGLSKGADVARLADVTRTAIATEATEAELATGLLEEAESRQGKGKGGQEASVDGSLGTPEARPSQALPGAEPSLKGQEQAGEGEALKAKKELQDEPTKSQESTLEKLDKMEKLEVQARAKVVAQDLRRAIAEKDKEKIVLAEKKAERLFLENRVETTKRSDEDVRQVKLELEKDEAETKKKLKARVTKVSKPIEALEQLGKAQLKVIDATKEHVTGQMTDALRRPNLAPAVANKKAKENQLYNSLSPKHKIGSVVTYKDRKVKITQASFDVSQSADTQAKTGFPSTFKLNEIKAIDVETGESVTIFANEIVNGEVLRNTIKTDVSGVLGDLVKERLTTTDFKSNLSTFLKSESKARQVKGLKGPAIAYGNAAKAIEALKGDLPTTLKAFKALKNVGPSIAKASFEFVQALKSSRAILETSSEQASRVPAEKGVKITTPSLISEPVLLPEPLRRQVESANDDFRRHQKKIVARASSGKKVNYHIGTYVYLNFTARANKIEREAGVVGRTKQSMEGEIATACYTTPMLYRIIPTELSRRMEGGRHYVAELHLISTLYGPLISRWDIQPKSVVSA